MNEIDEMKLHGFAIVEGFLTQNQVWTCRDMLYSIRDDGTYAVAYNAKPPELGVFRLMMDLQPAFLFLLELPRMLEIVDKTLGNTAILHTQNGFILPSMSEAPATFQNTFHQDFPRVLNGYLASINVLVALDEFNDATGGTMVLPRSHQGPMPDHAFVHHVHCKAGDAILFDSTLWHCAGQNTSGKDRCGINHQFTRSWIKQQIDYPRALEWLEPNLSERTKQLLGFYTRVPTSINEFYLPEHKRLYRKGQG